MKSQLAEKKKYYPVIFFRLKILMGLMGIKLLKENDVKIVFHSIKVLGWRVQYYCLACLHLYTSRVMESVALIDICYANVTQRKRRMLKVINRNLLWMNNVGKSFDVSPVYLSARLVLRGLC